MAHSGALVSSDGTVPLPRWRDWWRSTPGGAAWLRQLPRLVEGCSAGWDLTVGHPFESGSVHWVAPAELPDGTRAVLKVQFPDAGSEHEPEALTWWGGEGAVRLLAHDPGRRSLLIERCVPGVPIRNVQGEAAEYAIAAEVLRRLWKPATCETPFATLEAEAQRWAEELPRRWARHGRPFSRLLLDEAAALCRELGGSLPELVICHQDFHGGNVLSADRDRWLAVDPKPLVGEPALDLALLLRDGPPRAAHTVRHRLDMLSSELGVDRARARGWGIVHALVCGLTDDGTYPDFVAAAQLIASA